MMRAVYFLSAVAQSLMLQNAENSILAEDSSMLQMGAAGGFGRFTHRKTSAPGLGKDCFQRPESYHESGPEY